MKLHKIGIYKKLLFLFLGIMVMILSISIGFYYQGKKLIRNELSASVSRQNEMMVASLEDERQKIQVMQSEMIDSDDVISLLLATWRKDSEDAQVKTQNIQKSLLAMWRGSHLIEEASVIIPFCNLEISTGGSNEIGEDSKKILERYEDEMRRPSLFYQGQPVIVSEIRNMYFVTARLNEEAVISHISTKEQNFGEKGGCVLYDTNSGNILGKKINQDMERLLLYSLKQEPHNQIYRDQGYLIHADDIQSSSFVCVRFVPEAEVFRVLNLYQIIFFLLILIIFIGGIVFLRKTFSMIHRPIHILMDGLSEVSQGDLDKIIYYESSDEFAYIYDAFNHMTRDLKNLIDKNYRQEILLQKSELRQLQTQISPHFLYNSFITLSNRINEEDYEFASEFSNLLGQYFMFVTRNGREYIFLKEELKHACVYARIQYARFKNRFDMQLDELPKAYENVQVPRMIIQPIFENVFKYGVSQTRDRIFLRMSYQQQEDWLDIIIENSGKEIRTEELESVRKCLDETHSEIHGLANIHQRLKLIYNGRGGIRVFSGNHGGMKVILRILLEIPEKEDENVQNSIGG